MGRLTKMDAVGNTTAPVYGIAAEFQSARDLYHAAEKIREAGFSKWDVFSPFPIHGMDEAMGLKRSASRPTSTPCQPFSLSCSS